MRKFIRITFKNVDQIVERQVFQILFVGFHPFHFNFTTVSGDSQKSCKGVIRNVTIHPIRETGDLCRRVVT